MRYIASGIVLIEKYLMEKELVMLMLVFDTHKPELMCSDQFVPIAITIPPNTHYPNEKKKRQKKKLEMENL